MPQDDLLKRLLMSSCLSRPGWEMTLSYIFFLKLNLDSLTIYYDLQLCEGFCCIELVLTEICTLSANVMTISAMWMFSVSAFQLIAMHSFIVVVFWSFIQAVKESIFRVSDNGHLGSAWRLRVLRRWHQASCAANVNTPKMSRVEDPAAWDLVSTWPIWS